MDAPTKSQNTVLIDDIETVVNPLITRWQRLRQHPVTEELLDQAAGFNVNAFPADPATDIINPRNQ